MSRHLPYLLAGVLFGFTLVKSEAVSWYRIQEMFHFQSFHMYGIMFSAILTGLVGVQLLKWLERTRTMEQKSRIVVPKKAPGFISYALGGLLFGVGWGIVGLCPGPMFALSATGAIGILVALVGALIGTGIYGCLKSRLPH
jgi:uncharacterized membrane protein YedE/YeeE